MQGGGLRRGDEREVVLWVEVKTWGGKRRDDERREEIRRRCFVKKADRVF